MQTSVKQNITIFNNCYGCGICATVCPVKIISIEENAQGFYQPYIKEQDKCIACGLCLKICGFNNELSRENECEFYVGWTKDVQARHICSSGGIAHEIIKYGIAHNYHITSAIYDINTKRAEFKTSYGEEDITTYIGSKYIPSISHEAINAINIRGKNIVIGLPCQIDSLRRLLRQRRCEENFILVDFFCHGVPSLKLWDKYLEHIESKVGEITSISWRNKDQGWKRSYCIKAQGKNGEYSSRAIDGDLFYKFFLGNYCLNHCCYDSCQYKQTNSAADIRLGDCWGTSTPNQEEGVSGIVVFSEKGKELINELNKTCEIEKVQDFEVLNGQMKRPAARPTIQPIVNEAFASNMSIRMVYRRYVRPYEFFWILPQRVFRKILKIANLQKS